MIRMSDPLETILALQRALARAHRSDWLGTGTSSAGAYPPVNAFRKGDDLVIVAELAGVDRDSLDLQVKDREIRIRGKRTRAEGEQHSVHRRERAQGEFDRTLTVPAEIDTDAIQAEYRDGTLALLLPRAEKDKPRSITVN